MAETLVFNPFVNQYLDVESHPCDNVRVVLRPKDRCWGDRTQHWIFEDAGCGYYFIRHAMSCDLYLTVMGGLYNCGNGLCLSRKGCVVAGQKFKFECERIITDLHQPYIQVICLEAGQACSTGYVFINSEITCGSQDRAQRWEKVPISAPPPPTPEPTSGSETLVFNPFIKEYLDIESSACAGTRVVLRPKDRCYGDRTQHWIMEPAGCGYFYLKHAMSCDLYLTVMNGRSNCGNSLILSTKNCGTAGQKFKIVCGRIVTDLHQPCIPVICLEAGQACATGFVFINAEIDCGSQEEAQKWNLQPVKSEITCKIIF